MRYLGSKTSLLNNIYALVEEYSDGGMFCDPFGGMGTVGRYMKEEGFSVTTGDLLYFAYCFQVARIQNNKLPEFVWLKRATGLKDIEDVERYLSEYSVETGWFIEEYSDKRKFFTNENAKHIQACIDNIWGWKRENLIGEAEYAVLTASLIQQMDKVANTAGTYYAYLKEWNRKAKRPFEFHFIEPCDGKGVYSAQHIDAADLVRKVKCDVLYLDPPYNERKYGQYYHLPETVARGKVPRPSGTSGVYAHKDTESAYNKKNEIEATFRELIDSADASCIIFHYTDNGLLNAGTIRESMGAKGTLEEFYFDSRGYQTTVEKSNDSRHHVYRVVR